VPAVASTQLARNKLAMKINTYIKEAHNELVHKVSWPTWAELQSSAIVVMIASLIFAMVIFAMDLVFRNAMETIYGLLFGK